MRVPIVLGFFLVSGCGTLVGNVKPIEQRSQEYGIADLSSESPNWAKLESNPSTSKESNGTPTEIPDVAYQSKKTASIISINSACRQNTDGESESLRKFTDLLFLGMGKITHRAEKYMTIQGIPALRTTIRGTMNGAKVVLRTVVVRRDSCIYDLMYVARPNHFQENEPDFAHFVASLRLRG